MNGKQKAPRYEMIDIASMRRDLEARRADTAIALAGAEEALGLALLLNTGQESARAEVARAQAAAEDVRRMLLAVPELDRRRLHAIELTQQQTRRANGQDEQSLVAGYQRALSDFTRAADNNLFADAPARIDAGARLLLAAKLTCHETKRKHVLDLLRDRHVDVELVRRRMDVLQMEHTQAT